MKNNLKWQKFDDECLYCGSDDIEVLTDTGKDNLACDGDEVRCNKCGCPGYIVITDDDTGDEINNIAIAHWHDEPDCNCEWCKKHPETL